MLSTCDFKDWGHYHEDYVKEGAAWKTRRVHLTRLHVSETFL